MASSKKSAHAQHANPADGWQRGVHGHPEDGRPSDSSPAEMGDLSSQLEDKHVVFRRLCRHLREHYEQEHVAPRNGMIKAAAGSGCCKKPVAQQGGKASSPPASQAPNHREPFGRINGSSFPDPVPGLQPVMDPRDVERSLIFPQLSSNGVPQPDGQEANLASAAGQGCSGGCLDFLSGRWNGIAQHKSHPNPPAEREGAPCDSSCGTCSSLNTVGQALQQIPQHSSASAVHGGARPKVLRNSAPCTDSGREREVGPPAQNPLSPSSDPSSHVVANGRTTSKRRQRHPNDRHRSSHSDSNHRPSSRGSHGRQRRSQGWRKRGHQDEDSVMRNGSYAVDKALDVRDSECVRPSCPMDDDEGADLVSPLDSPLVSPDQAPEANGAVEMEDAALGPAPADNGNDAPEMVDEGAVCDFDNLVADLSLSSHAEADADSDSQDLDPPQYYALGPACRIETPRNSALALDRAFFSRQLNGGVGASSCDNDALVRFNTARLGPRPLDNGGLMANGGNFHQGDNGEDTGDFIDADLPGKASLLFSSSTASNSEEEGEDGEYADYLIDATGSPLLLRAENNLSRDSHSPKLAENQYVSWEEDNGYDFLLPENNCSSLCGENVFPGAGSGPSCHSPKSDNVFLFGVCKSRPSPSSDKMPPNEDQNNFPSPEMDSESLFENSNNPSPGSDLVYFGSGSNNCPSPGSDNVYLCGDENLCPDLDQLDLPSQSSESENEDFQAAMDLPLEGAVAMPGEGASGGVGAAANPACYHGNSYGGEASLLPGSWCYLEGTAGLPVWFALPPSSDWGVNNLSAGAWPPQQPRPPPPYQHGPGSNFQNDASNTKQKNFNKFATPGCAQQPLPPESSPELGLEDRDDLQSPSSPEMDVYMRIQSGAGSSEPVYEVVCEEGGELCAAAQSSLPNLPSVPPHPCRHEGGMDPVYEELLRRAELRHAEVEKVMLWNEFQAYILQVKQIGTSACGPTAILNVLKALECPEDKDEVCDSIRTNLRLESAPIPAYLCSRARAGTTAEDLLQGVEKLTRGQVKGRFFHFWPPRDVELLKWLSHWMKKNAVPILTMNQQKGVRPGSPIPDAWHHQMAYGVSSRGVYLTNPLELVDEDLLMEQLTSDSVLLVRRQDVVSRFQDSTDLGKLLHNPDPRWRTMNVLGQVINVLRESNMPHVPGYRAQLTSHVAIPAVYQAGVTFYIRADNPALQDLLQAPDLPELQVSDCDSDSDSDSSWLQSPPPAAAESLPG